MPTEQRLIRLTGVKNPSEVETHFASCMVDVAYVTAISPEAVRVEVDASIDLCSQSDRDWVVNLDRQALAECGESEAEIQVV